MNHERAKEIEHRLSQLIDQMPMMDQLEIRQTLSSRQAAMQGLADALDGLVKCNEEWNAAVESVVGRPAGWNKSYLDDSRAALDKAQPFLEKK